MAAHDAGIHLMTFLNESLTENMRRYCAVLYDLMSVKEKSPFVITRRNVVKQLAGGDQCVADVGNLP